jgi:hypothetical protein
LEARSGDCPRDLGRGVRAAAAARRRRQRLDRRGAERGERLHGGGRSGGPDDRLRRRLWRRLQEHVERSDLAGRGPLPFTSLPLIDQPYLTVDPHNAQRIFAGTSYGVWRSNNGGRRWFELDQGLPHGKPDQVPFSPLLAVDPNDSRLVYAAAPDFGVYRSHDGGSHWQPILGGLPPLNPGINYVNYYLTLVPDPQKSGTVYLGTFDNGVLVYSAQ